MAVLMCDMSDCKHRSKRALRSWHTKDGGKCYGCTRQFIVISKVFDPDGYIEKVAGNENMAKCSFYEPVAQTPHGEDEWEDEEL